MKIDKPPVKPLTPEQLKAFLTAPVIGYVLTPKLFNRKKGK